MQLAARLARTGREQIRDSSTVTVRQGVFDLGGNTETIGSLVLEGGTMLIDVGGPTQGIDCGLLDVRGSAALAGTLGIDLAAGFAPSVGDTFDVLLASEITLADSLRLDQPSGLEHPFAAWTVPGENGEVLRLGYGVTGADVPEPATMAGLLLGLACLAPYRRRRGSD